MGKTSVFLFALLVFVMGFWLPDRAVIPVQGASSADWNPLSFWYYPWGRSVTHKGIDIFARRDTPVLAATDGLVVSTRVDSLGGNTVLILGAKWRFHYYAHLGKVGTAPLSWVRAGEVIGSVGDSGNAKGKQPHLHYSISRLIPDFEALDLDVPQGWRKVFYVDPGWYLSQR